MSWVSVNKYLAHRISQEWELGKRLVYIPHRKKIKGQIVVSRNGSIYHNYYKPSKWDYLK